MLPIKHIIDQYSSRIKWGLAVVLFLVMILAIRTIINYQTIIDTTDSVKRRTATVQNAMEYAQNFQAKYLASEYGHLFLAHDNNSLFRGEKIISFKSGSGMEIETRVTSFSHIPDRRETLELEKILMTPQESWKTFIEERI